MVRKTDESFFSGRKIYTLTLAFMLFVFNMFFINTEAVTPTPAIHAETTPAPVLEKEKDTSGILTVTTVVLATIAIMLTAMYLKRKKR